MDQDQNFTNQWMVNLHANLSVPIPTAVASDDLQNSNLLYDYQLAIMEAAMEDFQSNTIMEQLTTDTWASHDVSNSYSTAADAASFPYSDWPNPTGVACPSQVNHYYDNRATQFANNGYTIWNENSVLKAGSETKCKAIRNISSATRSSEAQDHIMAERKRREKLNQRFVALSAVIPGLTKKDKGTVLADATKYVKQLQERIKTLEKQIKSRTMMESAVVVKKTLLAMNDINKPGFFTKRTLPEEPLPEIEVRFCGKKVLLKVHCNSKKGITEKILSELAKLNLTVLNSSVLAFGSSALDITILAQVNFGFNSVNQIKVDLVI
uniref:BHLH domain-containing protein n=1 Tax=Kalanchoe fedtschenkoi TaxID=63787 RepID=A0A7N0VDM6_KALFE